MAVSRILSRGWVGLTAALLLAPAAGALNITGLTPALDGTNTADGTTNTGNNHQQTTSTVNTPHPVERRTRSARSPSSSTRYAMLVSADRDTGGGSTTTNMTSSYSITFTVDNPTGANLQIDIDTLRVGALTSISDTTESTITLNAITGQLDTVARQSLVLAAGRNRSGRGRRRQHAVQPGQHDLTILTNAVTSTYVLQFDWASTAGAPRMEQRSGWAWRAPERPPPTTIRGSDRARQTDDGHFVNVRATIIAAPEPAAGALVAFGLLGLAIRARRAGIHRR